MGQAVTTYPAHLRAILVMGVPLIGGHLAQFAIALTDTVMLGWYGVEALAAITLAASIYFLMNMLGSGFAFAVMPLVAAAAARGDETGLRRATRMGLWLSLGFSVAVMPIFLASRSILTALGQDPALAEAAGAYLALAGWGLVPALAVVVLKSYLAALGRTLVVFWITFLAALCNAGLNWLLIFGNWGFPELGLAGAALASIATQAVALAAVVVYVARALPAHALFARLWRADREMLARVFRLGLPIGLTSVFEGSLFSASSLMVGWLGTVPLAAHGIVITIAAGVFMVHMGLSNVATIRAGGAYGRGDVAFLMRGARAAIALSLVFAALTSVVFLTLPEPLILAFLDDADPARPAILTVGISLLALAALFQLVDGAQVLALGLLRGIQDTSVPMVMAVLSYWGVGMTTSYALGFVFGLGAAGVWFGLVTGLACAATLLMARFWRIGPARVAAAA